jgi:membrane protein implicated in regulation of membrane protease activity
MWWLLAGALVALELVSGTFYLLMLALGAAAAALAAHLGVSLVTQLVAASVVGLGSVAVWYQIKKRRPGDPSARSQRSVNLDVGEIIQIEEWLPDGTAQVKYRGASWSVIQRPGNAPVPGSYRVAELVGSRLLVEKV